MGFLHRTSLTVDRPQSTLVPACGKCGLYKSCQSPKFKPIGEGQKRILIVSESPGREEDKAGELLIGNSSRMLETTLDGLGIDLRQDCTLTNAIICFPSENKFKEIPKFVQYCRPNLIKTITELKPRVIVLMGNSATSSLLPYLWRENVGGISRWTGWTIPSRKLNAWVCPTHHPAFILRKEKDDRNGMEILKREFKDHLTKAVSLSKARPWPKNLPALEEEISLIHDDSIVSKIIRSIKTGTTIAFDFESDRLKPDSDDAQVVCCSIATDPTHAFAYPWYGESIKATKDLLLNPKIKKIAANLKHEDRWCRKMFGQSVQGWDFDTMLAAHALDPRGSISSLKFQAFVRLGVGSYDHHIKPFLESAGGNAPNRVREVQMDELLKYNALDALLTYRIAEIQKREFSNGR